MGFIETVFTNVGLPALWKLIFEPINLKEFKYFYLQRLKRSFDGFQQLMLAAR